MATTSKSNLSARVRWIWMWTRGQPLHEAAVARTRAAVADGGGALGAVLWFQGESDTIEVDDVRSYGGKMERLVADLRADLGLPSLLVIQVTNFCRLDERSRKLLDEALELGEALDDKFGEALELGEALDDKFGEALELGETLGVGICCKTWEALGAARHWAWSKT